jgi:hypothetical protein
LASEEFVEQSSVLHDVKVARIATEVNCHDRTAIDVSSSRVAQLGHLTQQPTSVGAFRRNASLGGSSSSIFSPA